MKTVLAVLLLSFLFVSCTNTWDSEIKDMFHQSCMDDAVGKAISETHAKTYCDCVLKQVMEKYPEYEDALTHIDSITNDADVQKCKNGNFK